MERYLYELPEGWEWNHLGDYCQLENGDRGKNYPSRSAFITSGIPVINAGSLIDNEIDTASLNYISRERYDLLGGGKVREKDLLFCLRGSLGPLWQDSCRLYLSLEVSNNECNIYPII